MKKYKLNVIHDGIKHTDKFSSDNSILECIESMMLPISSSCRRGRCKACKVVVKSKIHNGLGVNYILPCITHLSDDIEVEILPKPIIIKKTHRTVTINPIY
ncbi:2Fe-2S iron-sulfur cluster-binding protein [Marinomonas sp. 2405UD68-3]|uniref:2Fe-2S iron-sulfur cluster-binding protein n=1 Tax=Marinomonas sp. 2405UD68-3 TaxID=3391835 RepID=UPI0039C9E713